MRILFTGDFAPILDVDKHLTSGNIEDIFGNLLDLFKDHDEVVVNLECPLTESTKKRKKTGPNLKASPGVANSLKRAGISIVSLANNHIMDFGNTGLKDTMDCLSFNGVAFCGAGANLREANTPHVIRGQNESIAIVAYAEHEYSIAGADHPGANPINPLRNAIEIKKLVSEHDYVIVMVHGGHEYQKLPSPFYVDLMRFYASLGVHAVLGHHTHCISLMETYDGVPICYGLGNFIFPWMEPKSQAWYDDILLSMSFFEGKVSIDVIPANQDQSGRASYYREAISRFEDCSYFNEQGYFESDDYLRTIGEYLLTKGERAFINLAIPNRIVRSLVKHGYLPFKQIIGDRLMHYFHSLHCEGSIEAIKSYVMFEVKSTYE